MNCCDDNGKCVCAAATASRQQTADSTQRTCDELGLCQWDAKRNSGARCAGCIAGLQLTSSGIQFAPGEIEAYRAPFLGTKAQRRELLRLLNLGALWVLVFEVCGLAVGLIAGAHP